VGARESDPKGRGVVTPYYQDDWVTIYHGDCLDVLGHAPTSADLVVTSPPYNKGATPWAHSGHWRYGGRGSSGGAGRWSGGPTATGVGYDDHEDTMPWSEYVEWQQAVIQALWAQLPDDGAIFYNHKPRVIGSRLWTPLELIPEGVLLRQIITWDRGGGMNFNPTSYMPVSEWIMVLAREGWRLRERSASGAADVWRITPDVGTEHPAPFPVKLPARAIESVGPRLVLDPFMGSGSTLRAAKDAGVKAIGIDVSERYCEMAARRMGQEVLAL
jgi:site-specific DNA-methyltransferase (adenine-specific)